jgi:hypothetical protein
MRYVQFDPFGGCWLWDSGVTRNGWLEYPIFTLRAGRQQRVNRFMYETFSGAIPEGQIVRHTCDVSMCVNPSHLILGTHKDNAADREARGRSGWITKPRRKSMLRCIECGRTFEGVSATRCSGTCAVRAHRRLHGRRKKAA